MARVVISINAAWNVANFRAALVRALVADGHEVVSAVPDDGALPRVAALGARTVVLPMASQSVSPAKDVRLFAQYLALFRRERPDVYLGYTIKPNTYGSLAAALSGVPAINNISGLGTAFIRTSWLTHVAKALYRVGLARSATVFFQNETDRGIFLDARLVRRERTEVLPGSGIDTAVFDPALFPRVEDGIFRFLLVARLLRDKGVVEFADAARLLRERYPHVRFQILGFLDVANRTAIDRATVDGWVAEGLIDYLGDAEDVRAHLAQADCVVLPSYREGTSRVLLEAGAMARPAITTDVPGCHDVVIDGKTGLLCRVRDAAHLAEKMAEMIELAPERRAALGIAARERMIQVYSEARVIGAYRAAIARALAGRKGAP